MRRIIRILNKYGYKYCVMYAVSHAAPNMATVSSFLSDRKEYMADQPTQDSVTG